MNRYKHLTKTSIKKFKTLSLKNQIQFLANAIQSLTQLKGWKIDAQVDNQIIYLRYPKKDKAIALDYVRAVRAQLRLYDLLPSEITISKYAL